MAGFSWKRILTNANVYLYFAIMNIPLTFSAKRPKVKSVSRLKIVFSSLYFRL